MELHVASIQEWEIISATVLSLVFVIAAIIPAIGGCRPDGSDEDTGGLTPEDATEIRDLFIDDDESRYRLTLPVFEGDRPVGTEVYGSLPLSEVRQIASRQDITFRPEAQVHAVIIDGFPGGQAGAGGAGGNGGAGGTGGSGGHGPRATPQPSANKIEHLRQIIFKTTRYQLLIEESFEEESPEQ